MYLTQFIVDSKFFKLLLLFYDIQGLVLFYTNKLILLKGYYNQNTIPER